MGNSSKRWTKILVGLGAGLSGATLAGAFGVQTGMQKLLQLSSPLGAELQELERLRMLLRKRGTSDDSQFGGEAAEAERERLAST